MGFSLRQSKAQKYRLKDFSIWLVLSAVSLTTVGILVIGSANASYRQKQIIGLILGLLVMGIVSAVDYNFVLKFYWVIYAFNLVLLLAVHFFGDDALGAKRWIEFGSFRFQPSELCKILMILFLAAYLSKNEENLSKPKSLIKILLLIAMPTILIEKQPDLSTSIVFFCVSIALWFLSGLSAKIVGGVCAVCIPLFGILFYLVSRKDDTILQGYQHLRIMGWLYPEEYPQSAYQQQNSIMAVGSGQLFGKGLYNTDVDSVKNGNFISEPQTDFIFAVTGEELGFIGSCIVIGLLLIISLQCIYIGTKAKNLAGRLICYGMGTLVGVQGFFNICVVTGMLPNTGLTLPFVSYGLTSLVSLFIGLGLVLNVGMQREKF